MSLPVSSNLPVSSLSTTNGLPIVSLTTTNGLPIVSLTTTNGLPIVTLSTASFPLAESSSAGPIVVATTVPSSTRARVSTASASRAPSFSLISPSKTTLRISTRVTTKRPGPTSLVFPKTTSTRRRATPTPAKPSVVTVTVTRRPPVVVAEPEPTLALGPPWAGAGRRPGPPARGRPGRRPWEDAEEEW